MTHQPGSVDCVEFADLAAAVAMNAAEPADYARVERHAAECPPCGRALDELRESAALLGAIVPQVDPPPELSRRLLAAARRERPPQPKRLALRPRLKLPSLAWPRAVPVWPAVAASLMVSIGAVAGLTVVQTQLNDLRVQAAAEHQRAAGYDQVVQVLGSDQLAVLPLTPTVDTLQARGMLYLDPNTRSGMVMVRDLPPLAPGRALQLWFVRGNERVSGGLLWPDRTGKVYALISCPADLGSFESVGLTEEPSAGSAWPTSPRIMGSALQPGGS